MKSKAGYAMLMIWIFLFFNGLMAKESFTLIMDNTEMPDVIRTTKDGVASAITYLTQETSERATVFPESTKENISKNPSKITVVTMEYTANTNQTSRLLTVSPQRPKPTYEANLPVATSHMTDVTSPPPAPARDDGVGLYILIGAACAGFLALVFFIILIVFVCKRCGRNDYTKADPEPDYDDEKGDISGARWVFNDGRQDWLYDGAEDDKDNQYVGPLAGKTGKRQSLMDKRYVHEGETFGRASATTAPKRPPLVVSESVGTLEGLTFGGAEGNISQNKDDTKTDDIADNTVGNRTINLDDGNNTIDSDCSGGVEEFQLPNMNLDLSELKLQSDDDFELNVLSKEAANNDEIKT